MSIETYQELFSIITRYKEGEIQRASLAEWAENKIENYIFSDEKIQDYFSIIAVSDERDQNMMIKGFENPPYEVSDEEIFNILHEIDDFKQIKSFQIVNNRKGAGTSG